MAIDFNGKGGSTWADITGKAACNPSGDPKRRIAIVLDGEVISSPEVNVTVGCDVGIRGGSTDITGDFTPTEAKDLAALIEGGSLPLELTAISDRLVGPTLGAAAIDASIEAGIIGLMRTAAGTCRPRSAAPTAPGRCAPRRAAASTRRRPICARSGSTRSCTTRTPCARWSRWPADRRSSSAATTPSTWGSTTRCRSCAVQGCPPSSTRAHPRRQRRLPARDPGARMKVARWRDGAEIGEGFVIDDRVVPFRTG